MAFTATARKEWQVMMRYRSNFLLLLAETVLMPIAYWAQAAGFEGGDPNAADAFAQRSGTSSVAGFIYLGWAVYMWMTEVVWGPGSALRKERMQGSLESLVLTPVSGFTLLFGPAATQLFPAALVFTAVGLMMRFAFGVPLDAGQIVGGVLVVLASVPVLFALGAVVGVSVMRIRDSAGVNSSVRGLVGILCGITYPVAVLPEWVRPVSEAIPITHVLDALRFAVLNHGGIAELWRRALVLLLFALVIGTVAMVMFRLTMISVRRTGRLGQF
ncbi:ABC transporter permease [Micromonospora sp. NPDC049044]|uniref:ABC transporter permease n=1 Tax=Micromonospora sp. NPDC049044 TaxID=3154827 RepID=UPI0033D3B09A